VGQAASGQTILSRYLGCKAQHVRPSGGQLFPKARAVPLGNLQSLIQFKMFISQYPNSAIAVLRAGHIPRPWHGNIRHSPISIFRSVRTAPGKLVRHRSISSARTPPCIHVLGLGSVGIFTAHSLAEIPSRPTVNLLLHRPSLVDEYVRNGNRLLLNTRQGQQVAQTGYSLEVLHGREWHSVPDSCISESTEASRPAGIPIDETITNLIVCVKSTQTVAALLPLLPRLSRTSNVTFLQNGAGMIEDANKFLWPDPYTRPNYITGVISHGITLNRPFDVTHTGKTTNVRTVYETCTDLVHPHVRPCSNSCGTSSTRRRRHIPTAFASAEYSTSCTSSELSGLPMAHHTPDPTRKACL
jgi:hypothetical protein